MSFQREVPNINVHVATAQPQPETSTAQAISAVGGLAGEAIQATQLRRATQEIQNISETVTTIGEAVEQHGQAQRSPFDPAGELVTEGLPDELSRQIQNVQRNAGNRFRRIANAVSQGAMPQQAAALEAEAAVKELVNQTPGFSKEIRTLARELLGYDPTGFALRQTLGLKEQRQAPQTVSQKRWEEAQFIREGLAVLGQDIPVETIFGNMALQEMNENIKNNASLKLEMNTIGVNQWFQESIIGPGVDIAATLTEVTRIRAEEGGVVHPERYVDAVVQQREAQKREVRAMAARQGGISSTELTRMESQIDDMYAPVIEAIQRNDFGEVLAADLKTASQLNERWGREAAPKMMRVLDAFPTIAPEVFNMLQNITNPQQIPLLYRHGSPVREIIDGLGFDANTGRFLDEVTDTMVSVGKGEQLNPRQEQLLPVIESQIAAPVPGREKVRESYVEQLAGMGAPVRAASILGNKVHMWRATDSERRFMASQFARHVGTTSAQEDVPGNLIDAVAREYMGLDRNRMTQELRISDAGRLSVMGTFYGGIESEVSTPAMKKLQVYLDAVNKNGWAPAFGVDSSTFPQDTVNRILRRVATIQERRRAEQQSGVARARLVHAERPPELPGTTLFEQDWAAQGLRLLNETLAKDPELKKRIPDEAMKMLDRALGRTPSHEQEAVSIAEPFIKQFEGLILTAQAEPTGRHSIGYGHDPVDGSVTEGMQISREEAEQLFRRDLGEAERAVDRLVKVDLTPSQRAALISLVFNVGQGSFARSRALQALNNGDIETFIHEAFSEEAGWVKSAGTVMPGLIRRRQEERKLFEGG